MSVSDAALFQFAAYVDGARGILNGASCVAGSSESMECSAPLPALTAGAHTIEIAAFVMSGAEVLESPRSAPLRLNVAAVTSIGSGRPAKEASTARLSASDGTQLDVQVLATDLTYPVDIALDHFGRVIVAERDGAVRFFDPRPSAPARQHRDVLPEPREGALEIRSLALAPDFAKSRHVFVLGTQAREDVTRLLVTRYREVNARLGEAAVLLAQDMSARDVTGVVRFGGDEVMYIAAAHADSSRGRIVRLRADGSRPADEAGTWSRYESVLGATRGLAWDPGTMTMWTLGRRSGTDELVAMHTARNSGAATAAAADAIRLVSLPEGTLPSALAFVRNPHSALDGNVIISSIGMADLLRLAPDAPGLTGSAPGRLLHGRFGAVGGVASGADGSLYFFTANRQAWGANQDLLVRLTPSR